MPESGDSIVAVEVIRVALPFETGGPRLGMRPTLQAWLKMECVMLKVTTADGLAGWGEAFGHVMAPASYAFLTDVVAPMLLGQASSPIAATGLALGRAFHGLGRSGPAMYGISAVDIALWDLAAQRAGMPLYKLLGGGDGNLTRYASLMRYGGDTDAVAANVSRAREAGFQTIKLHETTLPAFRAARGVVDAADRICLDVNCPWTVAEAEAIARAIADEDFGWLEEPVWPPENLSGMVAVRAHGVPISAGENMSTLRDFKAALDAGAVDNLQPSVVKCGGITGIREVLTLASAYPVRVVPHCFYWGPGYHATAHVAASVAEPLLVETAFIECAVQPHALFDPARAEFELPDLQGLGFVANWDAIEPYVVARSAVEA